MRRLFAILVAASIAPMAFAQTEGPVPDKRISISRNVDFYGSDLANIFDTTLDACQAACLANPECDAFTFNTRSNACFPKAGVTSIEAFEGAVSARVYPTSPAVLADVAPRAASLEFLSTSDLSAARDLASRMGRLHSADENSAAELLIAAQRAREADDLPRAFRLTGAAISVSDAPDLWTEYARLARTVTFESQTSQIRRRALDAATNAYLRAGSDAQQVAALIEMAETLEEEGRGRLMIDALRLAQSITPRRDIEEMLDDAIGKYGFRVVDTQVDSDAAQPRICAVFNEELIRAGFDYTPYVQLPDSTLTVSASGAQVCVEGVSHGSRYRIILREGLPAASGEALARSSDLTLYVRDRAPELRFVSRAYVLPRMGDVAIPVEAVNVTEAELTLHSVSDRSVLRAIQDDFFAAPLYPWSEDQFARNIGAEIWSGTASLPSDLNRNMTTRLPMDEAIAGQPAGIYVLKAAIPGADPYDAPAAYQWFILSDHGISTLQGTDGLTVTVRSLADASATAGADVTLLSRANAVLGTLATDDEGTGAFSPGLLRGEGGAAPAMVVVRKGDDMAFLSLTGPAFDLSDRGVEGRQPAPPIDVFATTDRGAYRAGETIYVTAMARDARVAAIQNVPLTAILQRPDGVEYSRQVSTVGNAGGHVFDLPLSPSVPRGAWTVALHTDPDAEPLQTTRVLVEDFLPERIDFDITLPDRVAAGDTLEIEARYLFGAPGAGLGVEGEMTFRPTRSIDAFPGFEFGLQGEAPSPRTVGFGGDDTDPDGRADVLIELPRFEAAGWPLSMSATVRLTEASGRPVERRGSASVAPQTELIGIRPHSGEDVIAENGTARFDLIGLTPDLQGAQIEASWAINRVTRRYQWYRIDGRWDWEPVTTRERIASGSATLTGDPIEVSAPVEWGEYEIVVERSSGTYLASSDRFYAGWFVPEDSGSTPDFLDLSLDAESFEIGDVASLRIVPREAGTALITVMSNRVIHREVVDVPAGPSVIPLTVTEDWGSGAYVSATVLRPMDVAAGRNPARSIGIVHASVDPGGKALDVTLAVADQVRPRGPLDVGIEVAGLQAGETAHVTLAAVDVGILNLTGFQSPDPQGHYFGQRRLGVEMRDLYGRLIDGSQGALGQVRSGGDASPEMGAQSPPPTEELVAYFSGLVTTGPDGRATVSFDLPSFNGTVRLMAVAWSANAVGQAETDVLVRDPIVVQATVPRFLAPGDQTELLLELTHAEGPTGDVGLTLAADGVALASSGPQALALGEGETQRIRLPIAGVTVGDHALTVTVTPPGGGAALVKELTIPVRLNDPEVSRTSRFVLAAGENFTFNDQIFAGLMPGTGTATLSAGPIARFDAPGLLATLDRYPYGCTEQVTSRALPLLYFGAVAEAMDLSGADVLDQRISEAISAVLANQDRNGAFGLWRPGSGDLWLDAYVTDFLSRAHGTGYPVPEIGLQSALDNLRNRVNTYPDFDSGGGDLAYALMVLAREGAANIGDLRYYADEKASAFGAPIAAAQLGAALAFYGEQSRADRLFALADTRVQERLAAEEARLWRADYGTNARDAAAVLTLAVEAGSNAVNRDRLSDAMARAGQPVSTQEATWTLLATNALIGDMASSGLTVDGVPASGPLVQVRDAALNADPVLIGNGSDRDTDLTVTTFGVPEVPEPAGGNGYAINRTFYTLDGSNADLANLRTGERLVAVLTITPFGRQEARLMVNDALPAGLEIDNPNLLEGGDISALDWLETAWTETAEFRSDRFLAAVDRRSDEPFRLAYIVRAVSPGSYHHPAALVEDMYRPQMRAWTDSGRITVRAQ